MMKVSSKLLFMVIGIVLVGIAAFHNSSILPRDTRFWKSFRRLYQEKESSNDQLLIRSTVGEMDDEVSSLTNDSYDKKIAARFEARYKRMYNSCPTKEPAPNFFEPSYHILVNLNHGLEVCVTGKAGSSSWHHLIWQLRQSDNGKQYNLTTYKWADSLVNHGSSKAAKDSQLLRTWEHGVDDDFFTEPNPQKLFRVIAGRHPFARIISGWNQKTMTSKGIYKSFLAINPKMKEYKDVPPDDEHVMSWEDFARYVSEHRKKKYRKDYHFLLHSETCPHCKYFFTYVVKLETLAEDYDWLMRRLNLTGEFKLGHSGAPNGKSEVNEEPGANIQKYMKRLSPKVVQDLYDLYKPDFEHFGYTFDFETYMAGGFD